MRYTRMVKALINLYGYRISDIAEETGVSYVTAWRWFHRGQRPKSARVRMAIENLYNKESINAPL